MHRIFSELFQLWHWHIDAQSIEEFQSIQAYLNIRRTSIVGPSTYSALKEERIYEIQNLG